MKKTGYIAMVKNLGLPCSEWVVGASPLVGMMNIERRKGKDKPVIKKKLVDLDDTPFIALKKMRGAWRLTDDYRMPGPIQHSGSSEDGRNFTLMLETEARSKLATK
jgi:pyrophosphate--fructose-6-phosphate 1-phosphotransferase